MLLKSFTYILLFSLLSFLVCLLGTSITYYLQGYELAIKMFESYVFKFDGIFVAGVGYGLLWFVKGRRKWLINLLNNILELNDEDNEKILNYEKKVNFVTGNLISIPVTIIGGLILWNCGYPLTGFAKYFLAFTSISLYYVGGSLLAFFIFSSRIFWYLEDNEDRIKYNERTSPIHLETFNSYFIIISSVGILSLYLAFRGTLTANFTHAPDGSLMRTFLIFPIILFSAAPLMYSFYPRYVIKRIYDSNIISRITTIENLMENKNKEDVSIKEKLETEKLLLDIKESLTMERSKQNIFNLKDIPSILLIILMVLQVIIPHDNVVKEFIRSLFN